MASAPDRAAGSRRLPSTRAFVAWLLLITAVGATLRGVYPAADPPWRVRSGVVWHDEGAWTHNARNRALFGQWRTDEWNPMYVAPVFTGLEYLSFRAFGVGVRQARLVSMAAGTAAILLLGLGVAMVGGRIAGLIAAALLATAYVSVMFDRAALMEGPMVAFLVASWCCMARARRAPRWGLVAGLLAIAAYFTKASAVFYLGALGLLCLIELRSVVWREPRSLTRRHAAALWALSGLAIGGMVALATFVLPSWQEYVAYNWQMSVLRKPSYGLRDIVDRASWFPIVHDFFTRLWFVTVVAAFGIVSVAVRWRRVAPAELLLALWVGLGTLELVAHDVGNERRLVFLMPALIALAALNLGRLHLPPAPALRPRGWAAVALVPLVLYAAYVVVGALVRLAFLTQIGTPVRVSAAVALVCAGLVCWRWHDIAAWLAAARWRPRQALIVAALVAAGGVAQFGQWASGRTYENFTASVALGERLPPGTLVHGKLANGLALDNEIRPVFVGRGFGNYEDRFDRPDVRYMLTYVAPYLAYEGAVFREVVEAHPDRRVLWTFPVAESVGGHDLAALMEK